MSDPPTHFGLPEAVTSDPLHLTVDPWWDSMHCLAFGTVSDGIADGQRLVADSGQLALVVADPEAGPVPGRSRGIDSSRRQACRRRRTTRRRSHLDDERRLRPVSAERRSVVRTRRGRRPGLHGTGVMTSTQVQLLQHLTFERAEHNFQTATEFGSVEDGDLARVLTEVLHEAYGVPANAQLDLRVFRDEARQRHLV